MDERKLARARRRICAGIVAAVAALCCGDDLAQYAFGGTIRGQYHGTVTLTEFGRNVDGSYPVAVKYSFTDAEGRKWECADLARPGWVAPAGSVIEVEKSFLGPRVKGRPNWAGLGLFVASALVFAALLWRDRADLA